MNTITTGVEFDTIAREWRMKWSADNDKSSLSSVQSTISGYLEQIKEIDGVKGVQRIVCGGCLDFKIIISVEASKFGAWEAASFAPEAEFLESVSKIDGISTVETQTYTIMPL
mmetsp:Transcript_1360/g.1833  ORF Transcript_1360/g.1833 Transcript_1360/m.1833 type:complete len:113 (-) Transcript_1360:370-708(-)